MTLAELAPSDALKEAATERVYQSETLRSFAFVLTFDWSMLPGFGDSEAYLLWLRDGPEADILSFCERLCPDHRDLITPAHAAEMRGVDRGTIYKALAAGHLTLYDVDGRQFASRNQVASWQPRDDPRREPK